MKHFSNASSAKSKNSMVVPSATSPFSSKEEECGGKQIIWLGLETERNLEI